MAFPPRWVVLVFGAAAVATSTGSAAPARPSAAAPSRVPNVVVDSAALEAAARVSAPIAEVTVYSDRAR
ncbi:MAG TPA: hypothetical protein VES42_03815, partial [Pilimelia sp.]|nr:hypothetical protein [Pilimelia sp.]